MSGILIAVLLASASSQTAADGLAVLSGRDADSGIAYALISLEGKRVGGDASAPRLTAQCTKNAAGKLRFELLVDAGDVPELRFVPPWKPTRSDQFPPAVAKATVTMEFLGYTKVKPVKRVWTAIDGLPGEWKYAAPGIASANMEEIAYYMQYLKALPTLRLTFPATGAGQPPLTLEFETAKWQQKLKAEPLCGASAL
jgi:hypothetical protein